MQNSIFINLPHFLNLKSNNNSYIKNEKNSLDNSALPCEYPTLCNLDESYIMVTLSDNSALQCEYPTLCNLDESYIMVTLSDNSALQCEYPTLCNIDESYIMVTLSDTFELYDNSAIKTSYFSNYHINDSSRLFRVRLIVAYGLSLIII